MDVQEVSLSEATAGSGHNSLGEKVQAFLTEVDELGKQSALGTTALAKFVERVIEAATDSLIKPYQAKGIYERYATASKNAGGTPGGISANASKLKRIIELCNQNYGAQVIDDALRMRTELSNVKSLLDGLADLARQRLNEKRALTDDEIRAALTKKPKAKPEAKPKPEVTLNSNPYKIPWTQIIASEDRAGLIAIRDEIDARISEIDRQATDAVDEAAHAPPAAATSEEEQQHEVEMP